MISFTTPPVPRRYSDTAGVNIVDLVWPYAAHVSLLIGALPVVEVLAPGAPLRVGPLLPFVGLDLTLVGSTIGKLVCDDRNSPDCVLVHVHVGLSLPGAPKGVGVFIDVKISDIGCRVEPTPPGIALFVRQ